MKKEDWYKIGAIVLVLAFAFEGAAIGMMQNNNSGSGSGDGSQTGPEVTGQISTNVTIVRYEPYLIVTGNSTGIEAVRQKLIDSGDATYAVPSGDKLIVNLKSSKVVFSSAAEFEKANATVFASASISTPSTMKLEGDGISTTVDGTSFKLQIRPIFEEGAVVPATFMASAQGTTLLGLGNFAIQPIYVTGAVVNAALVKENNAEYFAQVPWANRLEAKAIAKQAGATYKERSFILVSQSVTAQQMQSLQTAGKDYITGIQPGTVSVKNDFADRLRAEMDFEKLGLQPLYPPSIASFANASGQESVVALVEKLNAAGINATVGSKKTSSAKLPEIIQMGKSKYYARGTVLDFEQTIPSENGSVWLIFDFDAQGSSIGNIYNVGQTISPAQLEEAIASANALNATQNSSS